MGGLILKSKKILSNGEFLDGHIVIKDGKILDVRRGGPEARESDAKVTDAGDSCVCAGFIDMHTHGAGGADFMDGDGACFLTAAREHMRHGTTSLLPTTQTSSADTLMRAIRNFQAVKNSPGSPNMLGLHLEGPYFNPIQAGAQDPRYLKAPDAEEYRRIIDFAGGSILRWSVAPELDGTMEMGDYLREHGVIASIGHTNAEYETVKRAFDHGYTLLTHFYSAMSTITRQGGFRHLGVVESGYIIDEMDVEVIADGCHLPPELLDMVVKFKGPGRVALVTDSMRGAGMPDGPSILGERENGMEVVIEDGVAKLLDRSAFAGSVATADRLVRVMSQDAGLGLAKAVGMMTKTPARILGLQGRKGDLLPGMDADVVVFDEGIRVRNVIVGGEMVYEADDK